MGMEGHEEPGGPGADGRPHVELAQQAVQPAARHQQAAPELQRSQQQGQPAEQAVRADPALTRARNEAASSGLNIRSPTQANVSP